MITFLLLASAAALLFGDKLEAWWATNRERLAKIEPRYLIAAAIAIAAIAYWSSQHATVDDGRPTPAPEPTAALDLRGLFTGPTAADDAAALAALCRELAGYTEADGALEKPRLTTGWQIADLRSAARDIRLDGEKIGDRQPAVRDAVKAYLDRPEILGRKGGPLGAQDRAKWVASFRDIAAAAEAAIR